MPISKTTAPGLTHSPGNQTGLADRDRQNVGGLDLSLQIARKAVADGGRRAGEQEFQSQRTAYMVRCADDYGMLSFRVYIDPLEQGDDAIRGCKGAGPGMRCASRPTVYG